MPLQYAGLACLGRVMRSGASRESARKRRVRRFTVHACWLTAMLLALCLTAVDCFPSASPCGPTVQGEPDTRYYLLMAVFRFWGTDFGTAPEVKAYGGGPWWVPLEECEVRAEGLKGWPAAYVTVRRENGRPAEMGLWYGGVICRRFAFRYDASGRLESRKDTQYEPRREGEDVRDWVKRMNGLTPDVVCVREVGYTWSPDGRTLTVQLLAAHGEQGWAGLPEWPAIGYGRPGETLEKWQVDAEGRILAVWRSGSLVYSAAYDAVGRLTHTTRGSETLSNQYDAQGRLVLTKVRTPIGTARVFAHEYPGSPARTPLPTDPGRGHCYVVGYEKSGRVATVEVTETSDMMGRFTVEFKRDEQGRLRRLTTGFHGSFVLE